MGQEEWTNRYDTIVNPDRQVHSKEDEIDIYKMALNIENIEGKLETRMRSSRCCSNEWTTWSKRAAQPAVSSAWQHQIAHPPSKVSSSGGHQTMWNLTQRPVVENCFVKIITGAANFYLLRSWVVDLDSYRVCDLLLRQWYSRKITDWKYSRQFRLIDKWP